MQISGEGFLPGARVVIVTSVTSTTIQAVTLFHTTGTVDVVLVNVDGTSARLAGAYAYVVDPSGPAPSITSVSPGAGSTAGGGAIVVTAVGFQPGAVLKVGGIPVRTFVSSSNTLSGPLPAHGAGAVDVVVTNPDG